MNQRGLVEVLESQAHRRLIGLCSRPMEGETTSIRVAKAADNEGERMPPKRPQRMRDRNKSEQRRLLIESEVLHKAAKDVNPLRMVGSDRPPKHGAHSPLKIGARSMPGCGLPFMVWLREEQLTRRVLDLQLYNVMLRVHLDSRVYSLPEFVSCLKVGVRVCGVNHVWRISPESGTYVTFTPLASGVFMKAFEAFMAACEAILVHGRSAGAAVPTGSACEAVLIGSACSAVPTGLACEAQCEGEMKVDERNTKSDGGGSSVQSPAVRLHAPVEALRGTTNRRIFWQLFWF